MIPGSTSRESILLHGKVAKSLTVATAGGTVPALPSTVWFIGVGVTKKERLTQVLDGMLYLPRTQMIVSFPWQNDLPIANVGR